MFGYTHEAWNRLTEVRIDQAALGQYEYNALHWRGVKRARSPGAGSLDEMRLMYYSANWQLLEERIDRSWTSGFTEDERAQTFWGKRYIDDAVARRRDRDANGTWDDSFFYVTDAQFSTVAMAKPNGGIVERITYDSYGKARHHFGADVTGDGATTSADGTAIQNAYGNSIGDAGYKAELDLDRDGDIDSDDYNAGIALSGGVTQSALAGGMVSFVSTGSGGSTRHGSDNPIAWDGYVFNAETSQYLVRFRWYDPVLGRWLERDPAGFVEGFNLYACAGDSPLDALDPNGEFSFDFNLEQSLTGLSFYLRIDVSENGGCVDANVFVAAEWQPPWLRTIKKPLGWFNIHIEAGVRGGGTISLRHCPDCGGCLQNADVCFQFEVFAIAEYRRSRVRDGKGRFTRNRFGANAEGGAKVCYNLCSGDVTLEGWIGASFYADFGFKWFNRSYSYDWTWRSGRCRLGSFSPALNSNVCCPQQRLPSCF